MFIKLIVLTIYNKFLFIKTLKILNSISVAIKSDSPISHFLNISRNIYTYKYLYIKQWNSCSTVIRFDGKLER